MPNVFLTPSAIAERLHISRRQVLRHIRSGALPAVTIGEGSERATYRVSADSLERFLRDRATCPPRRGRPPKHPHNDTAE